MTIEQLINGLLRSNIFLLGIVAFIGFLLIVLQIFGTIVSIRMLFFIWRALGLLETSVHGASIKQRGLWGQGSQKALDDFHQSQAIRWRAAIAGIYVLWLGSIIVAAFFALSQPAAWLLFFVELTVLVFIGIVIAFN